MEDFLQLMIPDDTVCYLSPIATLVFMDLETTGLPYDIGRKNVHITELSMVAVDRKSFETDSSCRVLNKLSVCVRPRSNISFGAMDVTGLYDDMLETQLQFDKTMPALLKAFFKRLRPPICLLAHNGKKFDFPLFQAELKRVRCNLDRDILCADTLEALRSIIVNSPSSYETDLEESLDRKNEKPLLVSKSVQTDNSDETLISDDEIEKMLSTDIEFFQNIDIDLTSSQAENEQTPVRDSSSGTDQPTGLIPHKSKLTNGAQRGSLPAKRKLHFPDEISPKLKKVTNTECQASTSNHNQQNVSNNGTRKILYSLDRLYEHFYKESPQKSHHAEADCATLRDVCQKVSSKFLKWIDEKSVAFCETEAMW